MKRITTICLVVGLALACTDKNSVDLKSSAAFLQDPGVFYKGKLYNSNDPELNDLSTMTSISL
jgi:hypothetical protein